MIREIKATMNEQNAIRSGHVTIVRTPLLSERGQRSITPEKSGEPPTGVLVAPKKA